MLLVDGPVDNNIVRSSFKTHLKSRSNKINVIVALYLNDCVELSPSFSPLIQPSCTI